MTEERGRLVRLLGGIAMLLCAFAGEPAERRAAKGAFFGALDAALVARTAFAGRIARGEIGEAYGIF